MNNLDKIVVCLFFVGIIVEDEFVNVTARGKKQC